MFYVHKMDQTYYNGIIMRKK